MVFKRSSKKARTSDQSQMAQPPPALTAEYLKAKVDRVLMLLDVSAQPNEVKTAWLTLLPHMTLEQVDRLTARLEEEIELALKEMKKHPEDEELILKLKVAKERYDAQIAGAQKNALAEIARIEENLSALPAQ